MAGARWTCRPGHGWRPGGARPRSGWRGYGPSRSRTGWSPSSGCGWKVGGVDTSGRRSDRPPADGPTGPPGRLRHAGRAWPIRPAEPGRSARPSLADPPGRAATVERVLEEMRITSLGVIDDAVLELSPGLTVVTGETGAGKTMVVQGLALLMGARADSALVLS